MSGQPEPSGMFRNCVIDGSEYFRTDPDDPRAWSLEVKPGGFIRAGLVCLTDGVVIRALPEGGFRIEGPHYHP